MRCTGSGLTEISGGVMICSSTGGGGGGGGGVVFLEVLAAAFTGEVFARAGALLWLLPLPPPPFLPISNNLRNSLLLRHSLRQNSLLRL